MDRLRNLLKGKDNLESAAPLDGPTKPSLVTSNSSSRSESVAGSSDAAMAKQTSSESSKPPTTGAINLGVESGMADRLADVGTKVRDSVLKVVPLHEGDCLSCKLIGSTASWGAGVFILVTARQRSMKLHGLQKVGFTLFCASLSTGLFLLGTARLFDLSIFQRSSDGSHKSLGELLREDMGNVQKIVAKFESSSSSRKEKKVD